jgi:hypothetical protein
MGEKDSQIETETSLKNLKTEKGKAAAASAGARFPV